MVEGIPKQFGRSADYRAHAGRGLGQNVWFELRRDQVGGGENNEPEVRNCKSGAVGFFVESRSPRSKRTSAAEPVDIPRHHGGKDGDGNQLPTPERFYNDRFPGHTAAAYGQGSGKDRQQERLDHDRREIQRSTVGTNVRSRVSDLCFVGNYAGRQTDEPGRVNVEWNG